MRVLPVLLLSRWRCVALPLNTNVRRPRMMSTSTPETTNKKDNNNKHLQLTAQHSRQPLVSAATVTAVTQASPTVKLITLAIHDAGFTFRAGQWVDFFIPGVEAVGGFSMASPPSQLSQEGTMSLGVKFSRWPPALWVHEQCRVGSQVSVRAGGDFHYPPHMPPHTPPPHDVLLIGGGVGINPLASILFQLVHVTTPAPLHTSESRAPQDGTSGGKAVLLYSARTYQELLYKDELNKAASNTPGVDVKYFTTREPPPNPSLASYGRVSTEDLKSALSTLDSSRVLCYACGPPPMIENVAQHLTALGVHSSRILYEKWW